MAKQLVNPFERHLEKAALGLTAIALIYVVVTYVVASPNQLDLEGEAVSPSTIDRALSRKAESVQDRIRNVRAESEIPEPLYGKLVEGLDPYSASGLPLEVRYSVPFGPTVPIVDATEAGAGRVDLATVVASAPPRISHGRSTFAIETGDGDPLRMVANWVTVASVFDVQAQMAQLRKQYGVRRKNVVFGRPQLQRRERQKDGSWSDDDWTDISGLVAEPVRLPERPPITLIPDGNNMIVPVREKGKVEEFFTRTDEPILQLEMLRPMLPPTLNGDEWAPPIFTTRRDILLQDGYYLFHGDSPAKNPVDRYGGSTELRIEVEEEKTNAQLLAEMPDRLQDALKNLNGNTARQVYNDALDIEHDAKATASEKATAKQMQIRATDYEADIKRKSRSPQDRGTDEKEDAGRQPMANQTFWIHDARAGSVESGKTYQFRIRAVIANLLAAHPERFRDPMHAREFFIDGPWSDPVEVTIPPDMWFFITSKVDRNKEVGIEFFRWFEGVWVRSPRGKFTIGDSLELQARTVVPSDVEGGTERPTVEYSAGAKIVDIDFDRTHREWKKGIGRDGVRFGSATKACCVVMVDADGRLYERFVVTDKRDPRKKIVSDRTYKPPRSGP
jgi:hypothetical protein